MRPGRRGGPRAPPARRPTAAPWRGTRRSSTSRRRRPQSAARQGRARPAGRSAGGRRATAPWELLLAPERTSEDGGGIDRRTDATGNHQRLGGEEELVPLLLPAPLGEHLEVEDLAEPEAQLDDEEDVQRLGDVGGLR